MSSSASVPAASMDKASSHDRRREFFRRNKKTQPRINGAPVLGSVPITSQEDLHPTVIAADAVVEEEGDDELIVTEQPVEQGGGDQRSCLQNAVEAFPYSMAGLRAAIRTPRMIPLF